MRVVFRSLGGGLGVPYAPALPIPPSPAAYGDMVKRVIADWGVRLLFEPGRVIVGNAGALLSQVVRVKQGASQPFIIVDAAMNDLLRPSLYDARSEEHTSELQSLMRISYDVFCLKKKT